MISFCICFGFIVLVDSVLNGLFFKSENEFILSHSQVRHIDRINGGLTGFIFKRKPLILQTKKAYEDYYNPSVSIMYCIVCIFRLSTGDNN